MISILLSSGGVQSALALLLARLGVEADPAQLPALAENLELLAWHWSVLRGDAEDSDAR